MASSRIRLSLAVTAAVTLSPLPLLLPATGWAQIEEIIVSARKRAESLQEVPIAVDVLTSEQLERKSINSLADITKSLSSVEFDEGASRSDTRITIRGLSPTRGRQNVAVLVDGIDVSTEAISNSGGGSLLNTRIVDIERIEVVKGPQLALYGRSAFAGAIQYVTKDPSEVFEATLNADASLEDQYDASLSMSGPVLGDKLGLRFNAAWWDEQGYYENSLTGNDLGTDTGYAFGLTAKSQVTDTFTLKFRAEYEDQQVGPAPTAFLKFNAETALPETTTNPFIDPVSGTQYPPLFRCFEKIASKTWNQALVDRNNRLYDPNYTPTGPNPALPNALYSSPYCETAVASFLGAPRNFKKGDIAVATNPFTNDDYEGIDRQLLRFSLVSEWDVGSGTLSAHTGYIHEQSKEDADNGKFGFAPAPDSISPLTGAAYTDGGVNAFILNTDKLTTQFSQEIMFRTNYDGPLQATLGALYWQEDVGNASNSLTVQGSGSHCAWSSLSGITFDQLGFVEPGTGCYGYTERAVAPLIRGGFNFGDGTPYDGIGQYKESTPADRNTEHRSFFGQLEYEITPSVNAIFEGRYSVETVEVIGPVFLKPTASGGPGSWNPCGIFFRPCTDSWMFGAPNSFSTAAHPFGGPLYSQAAFENWYDSYNPNALIDANRPELGLLRDIIPSQCRNDQGVIDRLANVDAGNPDQFDLFNPSCNGSISRDDNWFSPKLTVAWQVNDDLNAYASWSIAEKPGGFSTLSIGSSGLNRELLEFKPEKLTVWEVGAKSQWLDQTLVVNTAAFFQDFTDKQTLVSVLNAAGDRLVNKLENLNGAQVLGLEMDVSWAPMTPFLGGNWKLTGGYTYLDAEYVDAPGENTSFTFIAGAGNCAPKIVTALSGNASVVCVVSLDGKRLEDAPAGKFVGTIGYELPLADDLTFFAQTDLLWVAKRYIEATNENWVEPDTNVDFIAGLRTERWEVIGYVSNVFDDDTIASAAGGPSLSCCFTLGSGIDLVNLQPPAASPSTGEPGKTVTLELPQFRFAFAPDPRVIGIRTKYKFGGEQGRR